jgi:hypothetical protein
MTNKNRIAKLEKRHAGDQPAPRTTQEDERLRARIRERMNEIAKHPEENQDAAEHLQELMTHDQ